MCKYWIYIFGISCLLYGCSKAYTEPKGKTQNKVSETGLVTETHQAIDSIKWQQLDEHFTKEFKTRGFNGNVLVAQNGKILYQKAFGLADFKTGDSLKLTTAFQIASVSKQFTATAIMMLKERGLLAYNDTVQKFLPDFPYPGITIRMLLTHRSGLPNYIYFTDNLLKNKNTTLTNKDLLYLLILHKPAVYYRPDRVFDYSNTGYVILASIVEKISGVAFEDFIAANIFAPLGMTHSFVYNKSRQIEKTNCAKGFVSKKREYDDNYLNGITGDKGIYSTVEDLFKWDQNLYSGKILKLSTLEEAFEPMGRRKTARSNYGFGWRMYQLEDGTKVLYHGGWWQAFHSLLIHIPKDQTTIVILKNREKGSMGDKQKILSILYPKLAS